MSKKNAVPRRGFQIDILEKRCLLSASPHLVKDLNTAPADTDGNILGTIGDWAIFAQDDGVHGLELWRSNGTGGGTILLKDINAGASSSAPSTVGVLGTKLIFTAIVAKSQTLWITDGNTGGTTKLADISGADGTGVVMDGKLYFAGSDSSHGRELWVSDGTAGGTKMVKDIRTGKSDGIGLSLYAANHHVLFAGDDGSGQRLWSSDGTSTNTKCIAPNATGIDLYSYYCTTTADGSFYFIDNTSGPDSKHHQLWRTNGVTASAVVQVGDLIEMVAVKNRVYYTQWDNTVWRTDGSSAATKKIASVDVDFLQKPSGLSFDRIFTSAGYMIKGDSVTQVGGKYGTQIGNYYYYDDDSTRSVYRTDGVHGVQTLNVAPAGYKYMYTQFKLAGSSIIASYANFISEDGDEDYRVANYNQMLLKINPDTGATSVIKELTGLSSEFSLDRAAANGTLYFFASDSTHAHELWKCDGTANGTRMLKDIFPGTRSADPLLVSQGVHGIYFVARQPDGKYALWHQNVPTDIPTLLLKNVGSSFSISSIGQFDLITGEHGVWRSDGTAAGTIALHITKDIRPNEERYISQRKLSGGVLYFVEKYIDAAYNTKTLNWRTDGTVAGTRTLTSTEKLPLMFDTLEIGNQRKVYFDSGVLSSIDGAGKTTKLYEAGYQALDMVRLGNAAYFVSQDGLIKTDGTVAGTKKIVNATMFQTQLLVLNGKLFILDGSSLRVSDGTAAGTKTLKSFTYKSTDHRFLISMNGKLYFSSRDSSHGVELWTSDGTSSGTKMVKDIFSGSADSLQFFQSPPGEGDGWYVPSQPVVYGGKIYFAADDGVHGRELWKSDGTAAGTVLVQDINPGAEYAYNNQLANRNSWPQGLKVIGDTLYFSAVDLTHGRELWELSLA